MLRIPVPILVLFAANVLLIALAILDHALGSPYAQLRHFLYLNDETTLQSWYSSMQWFIAACLFGVLFIYTYRARMRGMLAVGLFAATCLAFSLDEIAGIHEWLGQKSDALLPGGDRSNTVFSRTGIWPFLIGIPVLGVLAIIVWRARALFVTRSPRAFRLLAIGLGVMFAGALGVELLVNGLEKPAVYDTVHLLQHATEELLEMLGVTIIVWSGLEILLEYGIELRMPPVAAVYERSAAGEPASLAGSQYVARARSASEASNSDPTTVTPSA